LIREVTDVSDMRITTIIPWSQRPELAETLRQNRPFFEAMRSEVVVVNCGGDSQALRQLLASRDLVRTSQIDLPATRFNRGLALNIGLHEALDGIVFLLDADILLTSNLRPHAETCVQRNCFAVLSGLTALPPRTPRFTPPAGSFLQKIVADVHDSYHWADGTVTKVLRARLDCGPDRRAAPGIMLVQKQHLLKAGGYRSDFVGWGWEDIDVQVRLSRLGVDCIHINEEIRHLEHGDDKRDLGGPMAERENANRSRVWDAYCAGNFIGTYESDVAQWQSVISRPVVA
jgi:glycosyltransferase involved in cell wall biosynthesis